VALRCVLVRPRWLFVRLVVERPEFDRLAVERLEFDRLAVERPEVERAVPLVRLRVVLVLRRALLRLVLRVWFCVAM